MRERWQNPEKSKNILIFLIFLQPHSSQAANRSVPVDQ
jgi:hypothetical protein